MTDQVDFFRGPNSGELEPAWRQAMKIRTDHGFNAPGAAQTYALPLNSRSGHQWGNISNRRVSSNLNDATKTANAIRIQAPNSDVVLYRFVGPRFDSKFQAIRVRRGGVVWRRFGKVGGTHLNSFIFQQDEFIDSGNLPQDVSILLTTNHLIPTHTIADRITADIHDAIRSQRNRSAVNGGLRSVRLRRGRLSWDTAEGVASEGINTSKFSLDRNRWLYRDYLRFTYVANVKPKIDPATNYNIAILIWLEPILRSGNLQFRGAWWKYNVKGGAWTKKIGDAIRAEIQQRFDGIGAQMMRALPNLSSGIGWNTFLSNNRRVYLSHPCMYDFQRVGHPDHTYSAEQIRNICGWTTPSHAVTPGIRLLK
jgi:hypothetical protein